MTVRVHKESINLREKLSELENTVEYSQQQFWFDGDGSETDFALPTGWKPLHVFDAGLLQKEGSSHDYTVSSASDIYTVSFAVAPTNGNDIGVIGVYA
jgi:hypothetical protein